uniref:NADH-ubiquinone oxidoreductase chain 2 n=1 Tax=Scutigera coleoptrata TaxID=29022 RepID=Q70XS9_SCUCO|nr:NADH dehydrogenase subunit 2 [Scutigera coleoptrata]CAD45011.2 NADH dehydrogenase subunit 2 [Scutigera coleoptrata]
MTTNMKMIFWFSILSGTLIAVSSKSWISVWMGLEINLLAFVSLISNSMNQQTSEATLKYFLVQSLASSMFLFWTIFNFMQSNWFILMTENLNSTTISIILALKMGAAPFHFWFPPTAEGLSWFNCMILLTWQKVAPLFILMSFNSFSLVILASFSSIIGAVGSLNQSSLRKLMAYSSINHMGWILATMYINDKLMLTYFIMYCSLSILVMLMFNYFKLMHINQIQNTNNILINLILMLNLMSLGGLPPFVGFMPKWLSLNYLLMYNQFMLSLILVLSTLVTLYVYIRLTYSSFNILSTSSKWFNINLYSPMLIIFSLPSLISLPIMINFIM